MNKKVIVIGAGVAGLASAIRLACIGCEVTVFEQNNYPGGKLTHFEKNGYHFDAGPSLFTQPENIEELFQLANEPIADYFSYESLPISCKYFYDDGTIVTAYTNQEAFAKELKEKLNENPANLKQYLLQSAEAYNKIGTIFLNFSLHKLSTLLKAPIRKALSAVKAGYLFSTLHQLNKKSFNSQKTVQLFDRYATFNGSNPYKAPGMLSLIPHLDNNIGVFYPKGGMIAITNALVKLAKKKGVQFKFSSPVTAITTNKGRATGVIAADIHYAADAVVSNMDVYFTYKKLLNNDKRAAKLLRQERSSSAFIFYWGINRIFPELELHNIFFAKDYQVEFNALFNTKTCYPDPTIYVNITSKYEPTIQAPANKENWFVMVNAPANGEQDWTDYQANYRKAILHKLSLLLNTDIERLIEVEEILSPVTIESKTASYMGSLYGSSSNGKMAAFLRHPNFSKALKSLYFVGGSVHPGGGIPLCLQSARITTNIIAADMGKEKN